MPASDPCGNAGRVHPIDLVADLEARILNRAGQPMIGTARGERGNMPSRLQDTQNGPPQIHVERDARRIERTVHETDLVRRVRDHRVHAAVRQGGDEITAVAPAQADPPLVPFEQATHNPTHHSRPMEGPIMSVRGRASP